MGQRSTNFEVRRLHEYDYIPLWAAFGQSRYRNMNSPSNDFQKDEYLALGKSCCSTTKTLSPVADLAYAESGDEPITARANARELGQIMVEKE